MSLLNVKQYLQQHQFADCDTISKALSLPVTVLEPMLGQLERKGLIKKLSAPKTHCSLSQRCTMQCAAKGAKVLYCWCQKQPGK